MSAPVPLPDPPLGRALELLLPEPAAGRSLSPPARPDPQPTRLWRWNSSVWRRRRLPVAAVLGCLCSHHAASGAGCCPQHDRSARRAQRSTARQDARQPQPLLVVHVHPFWHRHAPLLPAGLPAGGRACAPILHTCPPVRAHSTSCTKHLTPLCCGKHTDSPPLLPALSLPVWVCRRRRWLQLRRRRHRGLRRGGDRGQSAGSWLAGGRGWPMEETLPEVLLVVELPHHRLPCCILCRQPVSVCTHLGSALSPSPCPGWPAGQRAGAAAGPAGDHFTSTLKSHSNHPSCLHRLACWAARGSCSRTWSASPAGPTPSPRRACTTSCRVGGGGLALALLQGWMVRYRVVLFVGALCYQGGALGDVEAPGKRSVLGQTAHSTLQRRCLR